MDPKRFDDLTRALASGVSRRRFIAMIGATVAGSALGSPLPRLHCSRSFHLWNCDLPPVRVRRMYRRLQEQPPGVFLSELQPGLPSRPQRLQRRLLGLFVRSGVRHNLLFAFPSTLCQRRLLSQRRQVNSGRLHGQYHDGFPRCGHACGDPGGHLRQPGGAGARSDPDVHLGVTDLHSSDG